MKGGCEATAIYTRSVQKMIIECKTSYKMNEENKKALSLNHHLKEVIILRNPQLSIAFLPQSNNMVE